MEKIVQIFRKKNQIKTFEEKLLWREELLYLLQNKKSSDPLIKEIANTLVLLNSLKENSDLEQELSEKLNLFLKYLNKSKGFLKKNLFDLIDQSEKYFSEKSKVSVLGKDFYCSEELSGWAQEVYYLMAKLQKTIEFSLDTWWLIKKAKGIITKEEKLKLEENLRIFRMNKHEYKNSKKDKLSLIAPI